MPVTEGRSLKPCCLISEFLEEAGIDRAQLRNARRQILEGIVLMCQWQLQRMEREAPKAPPARKPRRVQVD
jgi:hypothetical protein